MSFPQYITKFELSDYIWVEAAGGPETEYRIYKKDNYRIHHADAHPIDTSLAEILIPHFCMEPKVKLGAFLPQFDKILCELLVVADREIVSLLFSETMKALFPEEADNFEFEVYEKFGGVYSKIDCSKEYFKSIFGHERGVSAAEMAMNRIIPQKRTMFQERDEIWEKYKNALEARCEAGKRRRDFGKNRKN
ncbi:hypothetical protein [Treponema zioleckii]|uniref:hypothetical protein n=1 Tax=Treponema zioleckii TaxID=331680 RepID=UPI00168B8393|nr:hypothetical protein [Treponema zioleckii]